MARCQTIAALLPLFVFDFNAATSAQAAPAQPATESAPESAAETAVPEAAATPAQMPTDAPPPAAAEVPAAALAPAAPGAALNPPLWGGALRARWISLPSWFLGMFTKANRALSSYGVGLEGFRRKRDLENRDRFSEMSLGVGYQNMSPPDGNWLGNNHSAALDTDWVQFKNFGFWTIDFSYLVRQYFNEVFGIHYGAGLGLAIVQGDVLRTSSYGCTEQNINTCRPRVCNGGPCTPKTLTEQGLKDSQTGQPDNPDTPHRFREGSIPGAIPIINLVLGIDFRIPTVPGLELRLEGGFFDAFFLGGGAAYVY